MTEFTWQFKVVDGEDNKTPITNRVAVEKALGDLGWELVEYLGEDRWLIQIPPKLWGKLDRLDRQQLSLGCYFAVKVIPPARPILFKACWPITMGEQQTVEFDRVP